MEQCVYEDGYFETRSSYYSTVFSYIYPIYTGPECSDRSETLINRKCCFQRITIDVQVFSELCLSKKLEPFEVAPLSKVRIFLWNPLGIPKGFQREILTFDKGATFNGSNFLHRQSSEKTWTSITILWKQYCRFLKVSERSEHSRPVYFGYIYENTVE